VPAAPDDAQRARIAQLLALQLPSYCCGCGVKLQQTDPDAPGCARVAQAGRHASATRPGGLRRLWRRAALSPAVPSAGAAAVCRHVQLTVLGCAAACATPRYFQVPRRLLDIAQQATSLHGGASSSAAYTAPDQQQQPQQLSAQEVERRALDAAMEAWLVRGVACGVAHRVPAAAVTNCPWACVSCHHLPHAQLCPPPPRPRPRAPRPAPPRRRGLTLPQHTPPQRNATHTHARAHHQDEQQRPAIPQLGGGQDSSTAGAEGDGDEAAAGAQRQGSVRCARCYSLVHYG
jgi:hypothetical protein